MPQVSLDAVVARIQFAFPQIYYACHTRHMRGRSNAAHLSQRDSQLLVHLSPGSPLAVSTLARHMGLAASTVSEALTRLEALGFVSKTAAARDRRQIGVKLTARGIAAVRDGSVLETDRLRAVILTLSRRDRAAVVDGLTTLARACGPVIEQKRKVSHD